MGAASHLPPGPLLTYFQDASDDDRESDSSESAATPSSKRPRSATRDDEQLPPGSTGARSGSKRKSTEDIKAREFRDKRKKKEVKLNTLTSISGSGIAPPQASSNMKCFRCGKPGHKSAECKNPPSQQGQQRQQRPNRPR